MGGKSAATERRARPAPADDADVTDAEADETFREIVRGKLARIAGYSDKALDYQLGLGRWLLNWLILLNGGALVALIPIAENRPDLLSTAPYFVIGILLGMSCGLTSWINGMFVVTYMERLHKPEWLLGDEHGPEEEPGTRNLLAGSSTIAVLLGIASLAAFGIGGWKATASAPVTATVPPPTAPSTSPARP